ESDQLAGALKAERMLAIVSGVAGPLIVALTGVGLYGFCVYVFSLRSRELAIRAALGAAPRQIRTSLMFETIKILAIGIVAGSVATLAARSVAGIARMELAQPSPLVLLLAVAVMMVVTIAAVARPVIRATRLDLARALRME